MTTCTYHDTAPLVAAALHQLCPPCHGAIADWDGPVEVSKCVDVGGYTERVEEDSDDQHWAGAPFWSVYLHQSVGGVDCIADFRTQAEAEAFAAGLVVYRDHLMSIRS